MTDGSREQWLAAVEKVLAGRPFDDVLVRTTRGGLRIDPLYSDDTDPVADRSLPGSGSMVRGVVDPGRLRHGWDIRQQHRAHAGVSGEIVEDLEGGVTSIELVAPEEGWTAASMADAVEGVQLDLAPVALAPHADADGARILVGLWERDGVGADGRGSLGLDPIGEMARRGASGAGDPVDVAASVVELVRSRPLVHGMVVDAEPYVDAGATEVQELAWGTATGVAYLRALVGAGLGPAHAARHIAFRWSTTGDQFLTMAKLRAARRMWARVLEVSEVELAQRGQYQQAVTPTTMFSRRDPWVNLIRATTAALGAVVGGADSVTVLPYDHGLVSTGRLGRRAARNTQMLLLEESHLARSVDPGGGSWFIESLTDRIAGAAWIRFKESERAGGMVDLLSSGRVREELDDSWSSRLTDLGTRREPIVGVSEYPVLDDEPGDPAPSEPPTGGLPVRRPAEPFERLRDAADRFTAGTGTRPCVHIAAIGPLAEHAPRSSWIANLVAAGGLSVTGGHGDGPESPIAIEAGFEECGGSVAVICSSDVLYRDRASATALALKEAGAELVALAGDPGDLRDELEAAGVDEFWYRGVDILDVLERLHRILGVEPGG